MNDKLNYTEKKKQAVQKVKESLCNLFNDTELLYRFLDIECKRNDNFNGFSVRDTLLIADQYPQVSELNTIDEWNTVNKFVKKGEKGIILPDFDPRDGSTNRHLFDISQTRDYKKTTIPEPPTREPSREDLRALLANNQTRLATTDNPERTHGKPVYYDAERNVIVALKGISPLQLYQGLATELAHAEMSKSVNDYTRESYDTFAQMSGYLVCKQSHITPNTIIIDDNLNGLSSDAVKSKLETVRQAADNIQNEIEYYKTHGNDRVPRYVPHNKPNESTAVKSEDEQPPVQEEFNEQNYDSESKSENSPAEPAETEVSSAQTEDNDQSINIEYDEPPVDYYDESEETNNEPLPDTSEAYDAYSGKSQIMTERLEDVVVEGVTLAAAVNMAAENVGEHIKPSENEKTTVSTEKVKKSKSIDEMTMG